MSDLEAVLERLLGDPSFAASLAADPAAALAGYHLTADDMEILSAQVSTGTGGERSVETRTSQASMFGLLAPLAGAAGLGAARSGFGPAEVGRTGFGQADTGGFGPSGQGQGQGQSQGQGQGAGFGQLLEQSAGFGAPDEADGIVQRTGFGQAGSGSGAIGGAFGGELGSVIGEQIQTPPGHALEPPMPPPTDYHTRVDVNGDGRWDRHTYVQRADGGVDIVADVNRDGRADFVGHDYDRDGVVDAADYDRNRDGRFETHMFDDDGDGWMDRKIVSPEK